MISIFFSHLTQFNKSMSALPLYYIQNLTNSLLLIFWCKPSATLTSLFCFPFYPQWKQGLYNDKDSVRVLVLDSLSDLISYYIPCSLGFCHPGLLAFRWKRQAHFYLSLCTCCLHCLDCSSGIFIAFFLTFRSLLK